MIFPTVDDYRKYLLDTFRGEQQNLMDLWADGNFVGDTFDDTIQLNSEALGAIRALANVISYLESPVEEE